MLKLKNEEIAKILDIQTPQYPKYVSQIINLAGQNSQATRPKYVGQMSELIQEFDGTTIEEWRQWYSERHPNAIREATKRISAMINQLREAIDKIDEEMITAWVEDLTINKTFAGLKFQKAILAKVAEKEKTTYRLARPREEAQGIDGLIGNIPVSIKPITYKSKQGLNEKINVKIIYYEKLKDGIKIEYDFS
jgi:hypothetical protein